MIFGDLVVSDDINRPILVVEVKNRLGVTPQWAIQVRQRLLAHGMDFRAPYFLMAFLDKFYLWKDGQIKSQEAQPDYTIDALPILNPYFEKAGVNRFRMTHESLELIIGLWLESIIQSQKPFEEIDQKQRWVIESGLYDAIAKGNLYYGMPTSFCDEI